MSHTHISTSHSHGDEEESLNLPQGPFCWVCVILADRKRINELETARDGCQAAYIELSKQSTRYWQERDNWMESAAQFSRNADFYRGLVTGIGAQFGEAAHIADDGSRQEDVLCLKVPDLVQANREALAIAVAVLKEIADGHCCAEFTNGCPRHQIVGDRRSSCALSKAKNALSKSVEGE